MCIPGGEREHADGRIVDELTGLDVNRAARRSRATRPSRTSAPRHLPCDAAAPDFYRIARQQQFLRAVINKLLQPDQIAQAAR